MARHNRKNSRRLNAQQTLESPAAQSSPPKSVAAKKSAFPAVSVIIPMYNAQLYVAETLDSLLAQTFQDFEVIVVDDCSTDTGAAIVESYAEKFDGRLTLTRMKKNSGSPGAPRNKGLTFSRGEYVFFMDADDALTRTGLEEMYTLAKDYDADCVYCEKYWNSFGDGKIDFENLRVGDRDIQIGDFVSEPTLETTDLIARVRRATSWGYWVTPWQRLVSRKLLMENEITFPEHIHSEDVVWSFEVLFCAERFLRVPNLCYVWRMHEQSNTHTQHPLNKLCRRWMGKALGGTKIIDDFMKDIPFFREHQDCRYAVLCFFADSDFNSIFPASLQVPPNIFYEIVREEFKEEFGEHDVLIATLCALVNTYQRITRDNIEQFNQFAAQANRRIAELEGNFKVQG